MNVSTRSISSSGRGIISGALGSLSRIRQISAPAQRPANRAPATPENRAVAIVETCILAGRPELAGEFIRSGKTPREVLEILSPSAGHKSSGGAGASHVRQVDSMRTFLKARGITPADERAGERSTTPTTGTGPKSLADRMRERVARQQGGVS